ncbi:type II toxin-antitoxin system RelE/ParE family toxin [Ochrobactrum vermis]|uniref:Type II toxin-antitoxin system RelE/ParE family toxin n=1 Tax=Ochrobactrum vermis TaxID=1827297 RepID=A0ABU8PHX5_9HYPH|nr:type II toxin-antitoxin system RelE/ParE family toxin [Ochrobactrum vermis]PQZ26173.1 plasmid maintenance system killer [Ochrobactrum vermis]
MIKSFKNKDLSKLFETGASGKIGNQFHKRILVRLDRLQQADSLTELDLPGFQFHSLNGFDPTRYTIHVNGPWCLTFEFVDGNAYNVDFEQYH